MEKEKTLFEPNPGHRYWIEEIVRVTSTPPAALHNTEELIAVIAKIAELKPEESDEKIIELRLHKEFLEVRVLLKTQDEMNAQQFYKCVKLAGCAFLKADTSQFH